MLNTEIEDTIVELCGWDYENGYSRMFSHFYSPMFSIASRYVKESVAEDIVHDIFLTVWRNQFVPPNRYALKDYLYTSVRNRCLNEIRRKKIRSKHELQFLENSFEYVIMEQDMKTHLYDEINKLPENYKIALSLTLSGESEKNIAFQMNTTTAAIKAYKYKAKQLLKIKLFETE